MGEWIPPRAAIKSLSIRPLGQTDPAKAWVWSPNRGHGWDAGYLDLRHHQFFRSLDWFSGDKLSLSMVGGSRRRLGYANYAIHFQRPCQHLDHTLLFLGTTDLPSLVQSCDEPLHNGKHGSRRRLWKVLTRHALTATSRAALRSVSRDLPLNAVGNVPRLGLGPTGERQGRNSSSISDAR